MRKPLVPLVWILAASQTWLPGQTEAPTGDQASPAAIPDGAPKAMASIDRNDLQRHATWLAADERQGRHTGSAGQLAAAEYIRDYFADLKLKPLGDRGKYLQSYPLTQTYVHRNTQLSFGKTKVKAQFAILPGGEDKLSLSGKFAWCGDGRPTQLPTTLKGRLPIVAFDRAPRGSGVSGDLQAVNQYRSLARQLKRRGARAGIVLLLGDPGPLGNTLNYNGMQPDQAQLQYGGKQPRTMDLPLPLFVMSGPAARQLLEHIGGEFEDGAYTPPTGKNIKAAGKLQIQLKTGKTKGINVVAAVEGTDRKREAIVISAHHDHVGQRVDGDAFNGADDNASGSAALLELAAAFAEQPASRTLIFLSVSGEERGLWGSEYYADNPTWPIAKVVANINIDMIGRATPDGEGTEIQITPSPKHRAYSTLVRTATQLGKALDVSFVSGDRYYERSDHYNFAKKNIPVLFFCNGEHGDYHQVTDHADKLDYGRMETIARLAYWTAFVTAQDPGRPKPLPAQR